MTPPNPDFCVLLSLLGRYVLNSNILRTDNRLPKPLGGVYHVALIARLIQRYPTRQCVRADDEYFCPSTGRVFTCTAVIFVGQENMDEGVIYHEIGVSSKPIYDDDTVEDSFHLITPLTGKSAIFIGGWISVKAPL